MNIATLYTTAGLSLYMDGNQYVVANDHPNLSKIKDALAQKQYDTLVELLDVRSAVKSYLSKDKDFALINDSVTFNGRPYAEGVTRKVLAMIEAGASADPIFAFLRKVRMNPSNVAQEELLLFCVVNGFMIHEDGDILAYKSVNKDFTDIHSGKNDNSVGAVVEMARGAVDDQRSNTCSHGLHFASHEYAATWAGEIDGVNRHLMVIKIHPRDVVSIPEDYNNQKGRCCRYVVLAEITSGEKMPEKEVISDRDLGIEHEDICPECGQNEDACSANGCCDDICSCCDGPVLGYSICPWCGEKQ